VSKEYRSDSNPNYWFAFHPHQQGSLESAPSAYVVLGCGSSAQVLMVPFPDFRSWLPGMHTTKVDVEDRMYWHVVIDRRKDGLFLRRRKGETAIAMNKYLLAKEG
jgi:hypothetical protein